MAPFIMVYISLNSSKEEETNDGKSTPLLQGCDNFVFYHSSQY